MPIKKPQTNPKKPYVNINNNIIYYSHWLISSEIGTLDVVFCQIEIVLKDSTAFVYVTKGEKSSH